MDNSELLSFFIDSLEIEDEDISIETTLDEIDEWDSIGVLSLIGAADDELGVDLDPETLEDVQTVSDVLNLLNK